MSDLEVAAVLHGYGQMLNAQLVTASAWYTMQEATDVMGLRPNTIRQSIRTDQIAHRQVRR